MKRHWNTRTPGTRTLLGSLHRARELRGDAPAVRFTDGGEHTAAELLDRAGRCGAALAALGVKGGDRVVILCSNRVEFLWAYFGACWIGAVPAPLNTALRGSILRWMIEDLEPAAIVCEDSTHEAVAAVTTEIASAAGSAPADVAPAGAVAAGTPRPAPVPIVNVDADPGIERVRRADASLAAPPEHLPAHSDLAMILYTSGTTGRSKGIMYSQEMAVAFAESTHWMLGYRPDDVAFNCLPLFHGNSLLCTLIPAMRAGSLAVFAPRFSAATYWDTVREQGGTVISLLGSMVPILLVQPPTSRDADTPARIALAVPNPNKHFHEFQQRFGLKLSSLYGMTDIGLIVGVPADVDGRPGLCGVEHPEWECIIADENDEPVADGVAGELLARPRRPYIMQLGYWRNPQATVETWRNLWFHTGDILRRDAEGWFEFIDRKKDAIRRFGENISSFEVEAALLEHPAVAEAAVYAVPAQLEEDEVMASVVLEPGHRLSVQELLAHCQQSLPYFAVPRYYRIVAELPKTQTAKVQKAELRRIGIDGGTWDGGPRGRSRRG